MCVVCVHCLRWWCCGCHAGPQIIRRKRRGGVRSRMHNAQYGRTIVRVLPVVRVFGGDALVDGVSMGLASKRTSAHNTKHTHIDKDEVDFVRPFIRQPPPPPSDVFSDLARPAQRRKFVETTTTMAHVVRTSLARARKSYAQNFRPETIQPIRARNPKTHAQRGQ